MAAGSSTSCSVPYHECYNMEKTTPEYVRRKYLSVSTLVRYARCKRLYFYEKSGLRQDGLALAPEWGSCMHEAVPVALETSDITTSMNAFLKGWEEIEEQIEEQGFDPKKHNRDTARRALTHFIFTHKDHKSIYKLVDPPDGGLDVPIEAKTSKYEIPWALDIGLRVPLVGRLDGMCRHRDTGGSWVWELKTGSRIDGRFFDAHEMYIQNLTYTLVSQTVLEEPAEGVMLEGLLCNGKNVHNETQMIPVMQHHLEDVLKWLQRTGQSLLDAEDAYAARLQGKGSLEKPEDAFPKDFTGCTPYSHFYMPGYRCSFADLCRVPDWRALTDLYKVVPDHDFLQVTVDPDATRKVR